MVALHSCAGDGFDKFQVRDLYSLVTYVEGIIDNFCISHLDGTILSLLTNGAIGLSSTMLLFLFLFRNGMPSS